MSPANKEFNGWILDLGKVDYERVLAWQRNLVKLRKEGMARDTLILVEHPPVLTVGKDGHPENFSHAKIKTVPIERGGDVTYHGPGQLVVYFICNLTRRGKDMHLFIDKLQDGIIEACKEYGLSARKDVTNTGVWVGDKKIASLGVAVKQWITFHGVAINLNTDLSEFNQINPCGLSANVMSSVGELTKKKIDMKEFGKIIVDKYSDIFNTAFYNIQLEEIAEDIESQSGSNVI